ncbi:ribosomal-protein-alanine N-acetyltransferase [Salinicoccus halodurans]|uniref:[Ribosomal protein bS18]-alanine N-acetyltransferase n=2 Tax=Salinicoccus halodurans TaxID=407035 RepID=A0AA94HI19_9STAP|nr:ribosomal protein S18-alanine N-acetyltransferase [Salinicoccus halodurans]SFK87584.1 ribosomal-protein-alanine N-acetyltransferase [Salinicoccus halodurans]
MDGTKQIIRKMEIDDLEAVHEIESASFPNTSWNLESFLRELTVNQFAHYFVMEKDEEIIGYCGLWMVIDQSQITTIAISRSARGNGYGNALLRHVKEYAAAQSDILSLEVSIDNVPAMTLYEKEGFKYGGIRKDYYGPGKDAHVMWVELK